MHTRIRKHAATLCVASTLCAAAGLLAVTACARLPLWHPRPLTSVERIEGWIPYWVDGDAVAREAITAGFTDLLLFHGTVDAEGNVLLENPDRLEQARSRAAAKGVRTWLTVTNHGRSLEGALGPGRLEAHVDRLLEAFLASGCKHLDLDYESMTTTQALRLPELAGMLDARLDADVKLSFTLQPVDDRYRRDQRPMVRELLQMPRVTTVRFMMYDYAWRNSLPGALFPMDEYERLLRGWARYGEKLTVCLPLYGYDWPRPADASIPRAESVFLRDVPALPGATFYWMRAEGELAARYTQDGVHHMVAVPSLRAVNERVRIALDHGIPAVAFWHLGGADLVPVVRASRRSSRTKETVTYQEIAGWDAWLMPFKHSVSRVIIGDGTSLENLAARYNIPLPTLHRFNTHVQGSLNGQKIFLPTSQNL